MTLPPLITRPPMPERPRPIVIIGAGGIVRDAHLPAYGLAGFPVAGIWNRTPERARRLAGEFGIPRIYASLAEAIAEAPAGAVFDVALPASVQPEVLTHLPPGSPVLLQKPMGENLAQAGEILARCRRKGLTAAVNFQLRFAPFVIAARHLIEAGVIGDLVDLEIRVAVETPWHLWSFLEGVPFAEVYYHSIHYLDLCRSFLGEPRGVQARTVPHPDAPRIDGTLSAYLLDYGDVRTTITTNHHVSAPPWQEAYIQWTGSRGAIRATMGLLLNYPHGVPDELHVGLRRDGGWEWSQPAIPGSWFPEAFIGTMASVMLAADDPARPPPTAVADAYRTMLVADAACRASQSGGVAPGPAPFA